MTPARWPEAERRFNGSWRPGYRGCVPTEAIHPYVVELVDRCGTYREASRQSGVHHVTLARLVEREREATQARIASAVLHALYRRRRLDRATGGSDRFRRTTKKRSDREARLDRAREEVY